MGTEDEDAPKVEETDTPKVEKGEVSFPGPGRNFPAECLIEAKGKLKSAVVVKTLSEMPLLTEAMLKRNKLKHVEVPPRQLYFPCVNPLFHELRAKAQSMSIVV